MAYIRMLCYSEKQRDVSRKYNGDAGVVLLDGAKQPVLFTEMIDNDPPMTRLMDDFMAVVDSPSTAADLKSRWDDAIIVVPPHRNFKTLLNGMDEVTEAGQEWCRANNVEATPAALRAAAKKPSLTRPAFKLKTPGAAA